MAVHELAVSLQQRDCPTCGTPASGAPVFLPASVDAARLTASSFASRKTPEFMSYRLVNCPECTTVYASEAPSGRALASAYHAADYSSADEAAFAAQVYRDWLEPFLEALPLRGIALEIGTGTGVFLGHLKALGFNEVVGIEPSPAAIAAADPAIKPHIREGIFTGDEYPANSVSLIACFQTLEHVPDPREFVEAAFRMLEPGGLLALVTHDYTGRLNRLLGKRSPIIDVEHVQLFCPAALRRLVSDAGFAVRSIETIRNVYPLRYWMSLLPLPHRIGRTLQAGAQAVGVAALPIAFNVGNLLTVVQKPV